MTLPSAVLPGPFAAAHRFAPLREGEFRRFWYATLVQDIATWLLFAAQGWLLIQLAPRADAVALFLLLRLGPKVVLALPAGALCDRFGALPLLRLARFAGVAPSLFVLAGAAFGRLTVDLILISAVLTAAVMAFDQPAHRMLLHRYAPGNLLVGGVALNTIAATLAALAGPLVLALAVALPGTLWAFPLQALLAAGSGLILLGSRASRAAPVRVSDSVRSDCLEAVRYVVASPALLALILLVGSPGLLERLLTLATPGYAAVHDGGTAGMTLLFLAPATGALLGGSLLAWVGGGSWRLLPVTLGSSTIAAVSVGLLATTPVFFLSLLLFLLLGAAKAVFGIAAMAALQRRAPDHARGRVLAL
jgi:Transmembrane secretion effector